MKKILVSVLLLALLAALAVPALADTPWGTSTMYVKTENGKSVNVRSTPNLGDNIIGHKYDDADDDALMTALTEFQDTCVSYAG